MKRTAELKRTPFKPRLPDATPKPAPGPRKRKCSNCGEPFQPARMGQQVCGVECSKSFARRIREQQERKADRERKQAMKTRQQWLKEAQEALNAWVRLVRDAGKPCISCGRHHQGQTHAGHYLSRGAHPNLALVEMNIHLQCAPCNTHLSGNQINFRRGLIERYGVELVESLESDNTPRKYSIDDLKAIKAHYKQKLKELQK